MTTVVPVEDPSGVGEARRTAATLGARAGLSDRDAGTLALVVTELGTNLVKHTRAGGEMLLRALACASPGVEVLAIDRGPGMSQVADAMRDRYSTTGTAGIGLGTLGRMATAFELHSTPSGGSVALAQVGGGPADGLAVGAVCVAKRGEMEPGDSWTVVGSGARRRAVVVDGVGHGPDAAMAAAEAVRIVEANPSLGHADLFQLLHARLHGTRGAAVAVADLDLAAGQVRFAGVGNIVGAIVDPTAVGTGVQRNLVSHPGTVGHELHRTQVFDYPWPAGATLVLHSDGARSRWSLDAYPGLSRRHPSIVAGVLYRDFNRGTDDVTVAAFRAVT